jgi:predicted AlkP superfamily phosphohydrolase/phosphomutase
MKRRVAVIGLDGATFDLVQPWCEAGHLPTLSRLMLEGTWGPLRSTVPPVSAPAWTSFATGQNPGRHGLFDWVTRDGGLVNSTHNRSETFWHVLSRTGRRVVVVNVPLTYPPDASLAGVLVAGMLSPSGSVFTSPPELADELHRRGYVVDVNPKVHGRDLDAAHIGHLASAMLQARAGVVLDWLASLEWDLFVAVFVGPDRLQHQVWQNSAVILDHYVQLDRVLEQVLALLDERTTLFVLSDHGFGWMDRCVHLNVWLAQHGYLRRRIAAASNLRHWMDDLYSLDEHDAPKPSRRFGVAQGDLRRLARMPGLRWLSRLVPVDVKVRVLGALRQREYAVDWSKTLAYMPSIESQAINVNLRGREPHGIVEPAAYGPLRDAISARLLQLADPDTGEPVVERVLKREEVYEGPYVDQAADLLIRFRGERYVALPSLSPVTVFSEQGMAYHLQDGILLAWGPDICSQGQLDGARIWDLAPTILHLLSVPVPGDCDGRLLTELFVPGSDPAERPMRYQPAVPPAPHDLTLTPSEIEEIEGRLRSLGYLD